VDRSTTAPMSAGVAGARLRTSGLEACHEVSRAGSHSRGHSMPPLAFPPAGGGISVGSAEARTGLRKNSVRKRCARCFRRRRETTWTAAAMSGGASWAWFGWIRRGIGDAGNSRTVRTSRLPAASSTSIPGAGSGRSRTHGHKPRPGQCSYWAPDLHRFLPGVRRITALGGGEGRS
jgi:hypothetical protein